MSTVQDPNYRFAIESAREDAFGAFISVVSDEQAVDLETRASGTDGGSATAVTGVAYAVKDNIDTRVLPTTANTPALAGSFPATENSIVTRLTEAGALFVGKTNLHELAFGITTGAASVPATRNPHDATRSPGGSSGGSAAAVAAGIVPFALATDTGGSATVPAAWCGVYGYRPSMGRWPSGSTVPLSETRDTVGVIAQSLQLIREVDEIVRDFQADPQDRTVIRVGIPAAESQFLNPLGEDVARAWRSAIDTLRATSGIELVSVDTDQLHQLDEACGIGIVLYETARDLTAYLARLPRKVSYQDVQDQAASVDVPGLLGAAAAQGEAHEAYAAAMAIREELRATWDALFEVNDIDVLLRPTTPITAIPIGDEFTTSAFGEEVPTFGTVIRNTGPGSTAGQPSVTIPTGIGSAGLPVGVSVDGSRDGDDSLLAIAALLDAYIGNRVEPEGVSR